MASASLIEGENNEATASEELLEGGDAQPNSSDTEEAWNREHELAKQERLENEAACKAEQERLEAEWPEAKEYGFDIHEQKYDETPEPFESPYHDDEPYTY